MNDIFAYPILSENLIVLFLFVALIIGGILRIINKKYGVICFIYDIYPIFRLHIHPQFFSLVLSLDYFIRNLDILISPLKLL